MTTNEGEEVEKDEYHDFFKSFTGKAIKIMFKHIDRRLDNLEREFFKNR